VAGAAWPLPRIVTHWTEAWAPHEQRLHALESDLRRRGAVLLRGGDFDRWDCEVRGGALGATRVRLLVEEHGQGRQLARFRVWPHWPPRTLAVVAAPAAVAAAAAADAAWAPAAAFGLAAALTAARALYECGAALATVSAALAPAPVAPPAAADAPAAAVRAPDAPASDERLLAGDDDVDEMTLAGG
jgi:hypothetical protein